MKPSESFPGILNTDGHSTLEETVNRPKAIFSTSSSARSLYLPNGQRLTVLPVFGGFLFKSEDLNLHNNNFPAGWTVILQTEDSVIEDESDTFHDNQIENELPERRTRQIHPFRQPTLQNDNLFVSSISSPSSNDFNPPTSPTRDIAMMLWVSLYWYFHQKEPARFLMSNVAKNTPDCGKPRGEWRINIKREGILRGRYLIQKLERMGLVMSEDSSVGSSLSDTSTERWSNTFTTRRAFWQIPAKFFLSALIHSSPSTQFVTSPHGSRPNSPVYGEQKTSSPKSRESIEIGSRHPSPGLMSQFTTGPLGCYDSQYPTYYPPAPLQYIMSSGVRHPLRPKPPCQGEIFYNRYIPSVGQYLSFRTASLSGKSAFSYGPPTSSRVSSHHSNQSLPSILPFQSLSPPSTLTSHHQSHSVLSVSPHVPLFSIDDGMPSTPSELISSPRMTDCQLLHKWMNIPRVSKFWNCDGPISRQEEFLHTNLEKKHSFPVVGLWDGKPFGYFEIYWAKEDKLGKYLGDGSLGDWDRGIHVLVGEEEFRGPHRVKCWLTSLAHWVFVQDYRTNCLVLEPRIDNKRFISYLQEIGFFKEREVTFPHKQSAFMRLRRDQFEAPVI